MIDLLVRGFSSQYKDLNNAISLKFNYLTFLRCYIFSNNSKDYSIREQGILRVVELGAQALNYTRIHKGYLGYTDGYYKLEKSDKDPISYRTGESLLKIYSERQLGIERMIKIKDFDLTMTTMKKDISNPKGSIGTTKKKAREPDFIGIDKNNDYHILETKCRQTYSPSEHQHALNQVQMIEEVNSVKPLTRVACFFNISNHNSKGYIVDPENNQRYAINFNIEIFVRRYYQIFLELTSDDSFVIRYNGRIFNVVPFLLPGYYNGIEQTVKQQARKGEISQDFRTYYFENSDLEQNETDIVSVGPDGLIVVNFRESFRNIIEIESYPKIPKVPFSWIPWW